MQFNGVYSMYATSLWHRGFLVRESRNLLEWTEKGMAFDSQRQGNEWGMTDLRAPEVIHDKDRFIMTYSARAADGKHTSQIFVQNMNRTSGKEVLE